MLTVFQYIDNLLFSIPNNYRSTVAVIVLLLLAFSIWRFLKGKFVYLLIILVLVPGIWTSVKILFEDFVMLFGYIIYRI